MHVLAGLVMVLFAMTGLWIAFNSVFMVLGHMIPMQGPAEPPNIAFDLVRLISWPISILIVFGFPAVKLFVVITQGTLRPREFILLLVYVIATLVAATPLHFYISQFFPR